MSWFGGRTLDGIPDRVRTVADTSKIKTVADSMREESMTVTMDLIKKLEPMGFGERFDATIRGIMVVGYSVPIKVMCVGLYPYEQNILPPVATSLAYSPTKCLGSTPSVQILGQGLAMVASEMKLRSSRRSRSAGTAGMPGYDEMLSKFTMMLRCSYLCSVIGVAFINCVIVPANTTAKRVRAASMFSEWLGKMILIHDRYGFKMSVIAMGEFASDAVRNTFSSYKGTNTMINYVSARNPAAVSYMNIVKHPGTHPIDSRMTSMEIDVNNSVGHHHDDHPVTEYRWTTYPHTTLKEYMKVETIGRLARVLASYTVEELLDPFVNMSNNIFGNLGGVPAGYRPGAIPDADDVRSAGGSDPGNVRPSMSNINTGGGIFAQQGDGQHDQHGQGHGGGHGSGGGGGYQSGGDKSFYVGKNSILAQMNDQTGKSKSQQVIVLENMISKLENILESYRSREKTISKIVDMVEQIVDRHSVDDEELDELIVVLKERMPEEITQLEEATAVVAAMPALIEGDTGVIEGMLQPAAPLMRRYDGTTMRDGVYEQMMMDRNTGVAQMRNPPQSLGVFSGGDQNTNTGMFAGPAMNASSARRPPPSSAAVSGIGEHIDMASEYVMETMVESATEEMVDIVQKDLFIASNTGGATTMLDIMTRAVAIYAKNTNGSRPSGESMAAMIDLIDPVTDENVKAVGNMIKDLFSDGGKLVELFDDTLVQ